MKNFNLFSNKHFRFAAVLCLTIVLATSNAWGASPWTWTASSGDFGSSPGSTTGSVTLNGESWSYTRDQAGYIGFDNSSIQFGSKSKPENVTLSTSAFSSYTITGISVKASSYGGSHKVTIKVGGETVKSATNLATPTSSPTAISTGTISKTGNISIEFTNKNRALYIQQISVTYTSGSTKTLVYNANGGSGTMANTTGASVSAASCTFTAPTCKVFDHWNTAANNGGDSYDPGDAVAASTTLYAIWRNNPSDPTITFSNGNYTTGGSALNLSSLFSSNSEGAVTYSITNAGGTGASIEGTSFSATTAGSCTVQASQAADAPCYNAKTATATITVSAPTPAAITLQNYDGDATTTGYYSGGSFTLPDENDFVCGDLTFVGWSSVTIDNSATKPSAATYHEPGESVTLSATNTFYAVFAEASGGGGAATYTKVTTISAGTYLMATETATEYTPTSTLAYTGDNGSGKRGGVVTVSISDGVISTKPATALEITVTLGTGDDAGYFAMYDGSKYITQGAKNEFAFVDDISYQWNLNASGQIHQKGTFDSSNDNRIYVDHGNSGSQTNLFKPMKVRTEGNNGGSYFYHAYLFKKSSTISYSNYTTNCVNMRTIYLDAYHFGDTDGAKFAIYSWRNADASDNKLSDAFMTKVEDCYYGHLYEGEMPDNHDRVIFLRNASAAASPVKDGANKLNQTVDITTEANKDFFTIASGGAGNAYTGSWGVYTPNYAVTFSKNGVSTTNTWPADQCVASGSAATDPDVTPLTMGKTFVGWYQEAGGTNAWNFSTTISEATTIYAKWNDVATKTIYLDASATLDGGKTWDADNTVLFVRAYINGTSLGTEIKATAPISSCQPHVYAFTIPGNATHVSFARCATGTTELPASWTNPPVYNQIAGNTVENGKDHYVIDGWGSATLQNSTFTPTSYTISFAAGDYGTGDAPANDSKACGVTYVLPSGQVFSRNGYTMDGWSVNANGSTKDYNLGGNYTTDADQTFYPHWVLASYGVTLNTNGGTINAGNVTTYTYGTGATLPTDVTKSHATFQGWYAASNFSGDRVYTIGTTEYGDKQYYAKWEDVKWTVTWKANGATVRTDANIVDGNKVASVPSAPSDLTTGSDGCDAEFVGWVIEANDPGALSISSQSSTPSGMFTNVAGSPAITANTTFIAIYRQEQ